MHPQATLDHVVINVRDRVDEAEAQFRRLGFTVTPRGYHTLGSMNHLAIFGTEYLELIAAPAGDTARPEILGSPEGLNGLVFGSEDADATYAAMVRAGVPSLPPRQFSRPVDLGGESRDATFRTVRLPPGTEPDGRLYFCQHLTRDLVWRDEWRQHANGVIGVRRALIISTNPGRWSALFSGMFGAAAVRETKGRLSLAVGLSEFEVVEPGVAKAEFGDALADLGGRADMMAALTFKTTALSRAAAAMEAGGIRGVRTERDRLVVPATEAFGAVLEFVG